ncbi:uncharacterized protein LOC127001542 [Eriocheir sinensis]|uniref:uncharacterized protein LOC127001542 n=1 Tax=Eriocheir sinensis TaxID=95602 RepID=UPI0021C81398|nr:uncharacterized protein LOC127001542 [Eriocheir sinensis]
MRPARTGARWWLQEASVAVVVVVATLSSTSLASQPLQQDISEAETSNWQEEGVGRSKRQTTTPAEGVLHATPEPWEGFTSLVEALDILSTFEQQNTQSYLQENDINSEDETRKKKGESKREGRMTNDEEIADNLVEEEDKEGRFIFTGGTGTGNQQVTISVSNMWSAVAWIVLCILLIKWLVHVVTGKDLDYWGNWAANTYGGGGGHYNYPDQSTYTAYRALDELSKKYN